MAINLSFDADHHALICEEGAHVRFPLWARIWVWLGGTVYVTCTQHGDQCFR